MLSGPGQTAADAVAAVVAGAVAAADIVVSDDDISTFHCNDNNKK